MYADEASFVEKLAAAVMHMKCCLQITCLYKQACNSAANFDMCTQQLSLQDLFFHPLLCQVKIPQVKTAEAKSCYCERSHICPAAALAALAYWLASSAARSA